VKRCPELSKFTIKTVPARLKRKGDLFRPSSGRGQNLERAMEEFDRLYGRNGEETQ
jgi:hypothetical protein